MAPEVEKPKPSPEYIQKARTLICALNLISRNIPLPSQLFDAVASIYHSGSDDASDDSPDDGGGDAASGEGLPAAAVAAPTVIDTCEKKDSGGSGLSAPGCLMAELEDALAKQRPNCMSDSALSKSRENRLESHIQHRLTELEELPTSKGEDLQMRCLLELYGHKVRLQLEALLAEKSRLANENANLTRENQCLHQLVEYHQLTSQDLSASYEQVIQGMYLDFSSPSVAKVDNDNDSCGDIEAPQTPRTDLFGFSSPLDENS